MITTVKGFSPGETVKAFHALKAQPYLHYREQPPGAGLGSAVADTSGTVAIDLPSWTPVSLVRADGTSILVENATTTVST